MIAGPWIDVRELTTDGADAGSPVAADMVSLEQDGPRVEVRLVDGAVAGTPTSVTFGVWRKSGAYVDKLGTFTVTGASIATSQPAIFELYDGNVYVTVESFSGGTSPTVSGTLQARVARGG